MEVDELDIKDKFATGLPGPWVVTVGEFGRNPEAAFFSAGHELESLGPAVDDFVEREFGGFSTRGRAVEDFSVCRHACIMGSDGGEGVGSGAALAGAEDF